MNELMRPAQDVGSRMREMASSGVSQARKAYDDFSDATEKATAAMETSFRHAWLGARDMNQRMLSFANTNAKLAFDYAERIAAAGSPSEALTLQQEFLRVQAERMGNQMRELNELAARSTRDAQEAIKIK